MGRAVIRLETTFWHLLTFDHVAADFSVDSILSMVQKTFVLKRYISNGETFCKIYHKLKCIGTNYSNW